MEGPFLIVGLGNPGPAYRLSRHNAGAWVVRQLARRKDIRWGQWIGLCPGGEGWWEGRPVVLGVPRTYMNDSGRAVAALRARWPVPLDQLLVVCDDVALPFGMVRIRPRGSDGGHKGLRSLGEALGSTAFPRLRIGIGAPDIPEALEAFVLSPFSRRECERLPQVLEMAATACAMWLREGMAAAMNRYNRKVRR